VTPIKKLLCPVDCSDASKNALEYALFVSKHFNAEMHLLHAWHVNYHVRPDLSVWMETHGQQPITRVVEQEARKETELFLSALDPATRAALKIHVLEGEPAKTITDLAVSEQVDLIVMGTHGRSAVLQIALGSVAEKVVRHAHCPVLTVRVPKHAS
jgi:nucleotide-binding universal stress UspA family protein